MKGRFYRLIRDLHLYFGLFISPFVLVFAISVFYLVHTGLPNKAAEATTRRVVANLPLPGDLKSLSGRPLIDALRPSLDRAEVYGEVGFVRQVRKDNKLILPVTVPGRITTVTIDLTKAEALIEQRITGLGDAIVELHKAPGPHLVDLRMNWFPMRIWLWLADATVYLVLFLSVSGLYLWYALRAERWAGFCLLAAGALSFFGIVYALCY